MGEDQERGSQCVCVFRSTKREGSREGMRAVLKAAAATAQTRLVTGRPAGCGVLRRATATRRNCGATASVFGTGTGLSCPRRVIGTGTQTRGGSLIVEANAKRCLGSTKGGTNRHRKRTSGFRVRKRSATGSKVLKNRRKKGRKQLAPASKHSGKK